VIVAKREKIGGTELGAGCKQAFVRPDLQSEDMSAYGTSQTSIPKMNESALGGKADIPNPRFDVR
jgi:hypothetical protein